VSFPYGQCTWWCAHEEPWVLRCDHLGNALDWAANWRSIGGYVTSRPAIGDIACFQPYVDGADAVFGHVAVVIAVSGVFFTVSEMNGPAGPGRVDDRVCKLNPGVSFLAESAPAPPQTPQEDDVYYLVSIAGDPNAGVYRLGGGFYVGVATPADVAAFKAAGDKSITVSALQHARYLAAAKGTP
jgi:surface antigen